MSGILLAAPSPPWGVRQGEWHLHSDGLDLLLLQTNGGSGPKYVLQPLLLELVCISALVQVHKMWPASMPMMLLRLCLCLWVYLCWLTCGRCQSADVNVDVDELQLKDGQNDESTYADNAMGRPWR
mmetsp:Transcript_39224/g.90601  ORF Transcript_39224/g.90601 Transcript_39224/m.90601 type:complete len:126 (+) Transcript_39224:130-507(+)